MVLRSVLGPVFEFEWLTGSRRWQIYAARALFVAMLLASLSLVWWAEVAGRSVATIQAQAEVGQSFSTAIVGTQLVLVLLAAPAATAGAICQDKARGNLDHLLATDLSASEIVLGKLAARLVPIFGMIACALPVMAIGTLLGGIDPIGLTGAFLLALGTAAIGCTLALLISVWGTRTHEVLMVTYCVLLAWVLSGPAQFLLRMLTGWSWWLPDWFLASNPFRIAFWRADTHSLAPHAAFLAGAGAVSAFLAALATLRLRPAAARGGDAPPRRKRRASARGGGGGRTLFGPSLDGNPVLWREWHRRRPTRSAWILWRVFAVAATLAALVTIDAIFENSRSTLEAGMLFLGGQVALGFLFLSVSASSSLAEERTRGSLDILLATPLSTRTILLGKWWGAYRGTMLLSILPALVACAIALKEGRWPGVVLVPGLVLAYGAALTSLGLALATWIPRLGRAIAATVAAHIAVTVGWFFAAVLFTRNVHGTTGVGLASASPFVGIIFALVAMKETASTDWNECIAWISGWMLVEAMTAVVLLGAAILSFDECLGRAAASPLDRPRPARAATPRPVPSRD